MTIEKVTAGPNDRFLVEIDVGRMPPNRAKDYLANVVEKFKGFFPKDTAMFIPMRDGVPSVRVSVISKEETETT